MTCCTRRPASGPARGYYYQLISSAGWTSLPLLPRLRPPTLILAGDDDPIIPLVNARIMHRLIPHSQLHIYHGGHLELAADAEHIAPVVEAFLDADLTTPESQARKEASDDAGDERASRGIPRHGLLLRPRAVHRRAVVALHHRPAVRRRGGRAGRRPVLGTGRDLLAAGQAAARARHRRRGHQGIRLRRDEPDGVRAGHDGTAPRRRQPRRVPRRARGPGHAVDRDVRLGGAEGALAA